LQHLFGVTISSKLEKLETIEGRLDKLQNIDGKLISWTRWTTSRDWKNCENNAKRSIIQTIDSQKKKV